MNLNTYKILVVDDDPDIVELLKFNLSSEGYKVKSASNGIQALSLAMEFIPDLTICRHHDAQYGWCRNLSPNPIHS